MGNTHATAHPLGGCINGERCQKVASSITNASCLTGNDEAPEKVHEGLYVVDGSIMPSSLGANPLMTITALAERAMMLMAKDQGWTLKV